MSRVHSHIPYWPRGLKEALAAEYVGLSVSTFRAEVAHDRAPKPVLLTMRRQVWMRDALDAWLDGKAGVAAPAQERDLWAEAIAADGQGGTALR